MDRIDSKILQILQHNARETASNISKDLILKITCNSADELEKIHRQIMSLDGIKDTRTHVVLKTVKNIYSSLRDPDLTGTSSRRNTIIQK